jgi:hypothetical protein
MEPETHSRAIEAAENAMFYREPLEAAVLDRFSATHFRGRSDTIPPRRGGRADGQARFTSGFPFSTM